MLTRLVETPPRKAADARASNHDATSRHLGLSCRSRARDVAEQVGITERAAQRILADLIADSYATRTKVGRRNHYEINSRGHLRHPSFAIFRSGRS